MDIPSSGCGYNTIARELSRSTYFMHGIGYQSFQWSSDVDGMRTQHEGTPERSYQRKIGYESQILLRHDKRVTGIFLAISQFPMELMY